MALAISGELPTAVFLGSCLPSAALLILSVMTDCFKKSLWLAFSVGLSVFPLLSAFLPQLYCRGFVKDVDFSL